jgi:hypothetical protein
VRVLAPLHKPRSADELSTLDTQRSLRMTAEVEDLKRGSKRMWEQQLEARELEQRGRRPRARELQRRGPCRRNGECALANSAGSRSCARASRPPGA